MKKPLEQIDINRIIANAINQGYEYYKAEALRYAKSYPNGEAGVEVQNAEERLVAHIRRQLKWKIYIENDEKNP